MAKNSGTKLNGRSDNRNCESVETGSCNETENPLRIEQGKKLVKYNCRKKEEPKRLNEQITKQDRIEDKPKPDTNTYVYVSSLLCAWISNRWISPV